MGFLKRLARTVGKAAKSKIGQTLIRGAAASLTGGASEAAIRGVQTAKSLGIGARERKSKQNQPVSVQAAVIKMRRQPRPTLTGGVTPDTAPGGAPLKGRRRQPSGRPFPRGVRVRA